MQSQKRVLAVHDLSGVGKCSLTVALPIISAAGVECSALPTAFLSTHTGGFVGYTCRDLTDDIAPVARHWQTLGVRFDAIYTGYLASFAQIDLVADLIDALAMPDTAVIIDPVMGDNGRLYAGFDMTFPQAMQRLCGKASVIMPNLTEAALLLGESYAEGPYTKTCIESILRRLARATGARAVVLTGVWFDETALGAATYTPEDDRVTYLLDRKVPGSYHGTGDVFGSAVVGALTCGKPLNDAVRAAVSLTVAAIARSAAAGTEIRYGVNFEAELPTYMRALGIL